MGVRALSTFSPASGRAGRKKSHPPHQRRNGFTVVAPVEGVYPFRLVYWQTTRLAILEWYLVLNPGTDTEQRVLINDPSLKPLAEITCVTFRDDAILPICVPGIPVDSTLMLGGFSLAITARRKMYLPAMRVELERYPDFVKFVSECANIDRTRVSLEKR